MATCAVADETLPIWSSEAPDENQEGICITAAKTGFLLLQTLYAPPTWLC